MTDLDDSLREALRQNGELDSSRDKDLQEKVMGRFRAKMRRVERYMLLTLLICGGLAGGAISVLLSTSNTQLMLAYGIVFLVTFETTILIRLWYWIANNKLSVLKEIQLLRLGASTAPEFDAGTILPGKRERYLPKWERRMYGAIGAILLIAVLVISTIGFTDRADSTVREITVLAPDGSGKDVIYQSGKQGSMVQPATSFEFYTGANFEAGNIKWYDDKDRELPVVKNKDGDNIRYTIFLIDPQCTNTRREFKSERLAKVENGLWTYNTDYYSSSPVDHVQKLILPAEAAVENVTPKPLSIEKTGEGLTILWQLKTKAKEKYERKVQYRLLDDAY
jgi:hypothetical protein